MKKPIVIVLVICILCVGIVGAILFWKQKQKPIVSAPTQVKTLNVEETVLWEDQAGFSFQYPKVLLFDKHDEDEENYAHIEFTSATHSGRLIVWAKDTTYSDVEGWAKNAVAVDTKLGGLPAKKIIISTPSKKIIIGTISDQILFTVEAEPTEGDSFWTTVSDTIVSSFTFTQANTDASAPSQEASYDEEEVVE